MLRGALQHLLTHGAGHGLELCSSRHTWDRLTPWEPHLGPEDHLDGAGKEAPRQVCEQLGAHLNRSGHVHERLQLRPGRLQLPLHLLQQLPGVWNSCAASLDMPQGAQRTILPKGCSRCSSAGLGQLPLPRINLSQPAPCKLSVSHPSAHLGCNGRRPIANSNAIGGHGTSRAITPI